MCYIIVLSSHFFPNEWGKPTCSANMYAELPTCILFIFFREMANLRQFHAVHLWANDSASSEASELHVEMFTDLRIYVTIPDAR